MNLADGIKAAQFLAAKRGAELYGVEVLADGSVRGMETTKGTAKAAAKELAKQQAEDYPQQTKRGVRAAQGAFEL